MSNNFEYRTMLIKLLSSKDLVFITLVVCSRSFKVRIINKEKRKQSVRVKV